MLTKRIIPCLDIKDSRVVKGINFEGLADAGDPVQLAKRYEIQGADELVFLDISATNDKRKTLSNLAREVASELSIPFTVGGGISSADDVGILLDCGADKISINSAAVFRPKLIEEIASRYGQQCVVVAIDAKKIGERYIVHTHGGKRETELDLFEWARRVYDAGAGEILYTSMDCDGTKDGFAIESLRRMVEMLPIPVIASGGAGSEEDFLEVFQMAGVDAALAASVFHYGQIGIPELKTYLKDNGVDVRIIS